MPAFLYTALTPQGALQRGEGVAPSADELRRELSEKGLLVQSVQARRERSLLKRLRLEDLLLFNQEFKALIGAGLTLPDALALASERPDAPYLEQALRRILADVREGSTLSDACARHPEVFDPLFIAAVRIGEKTGNLLDVLGHYHGFLQQRVALRKKVGQALAYPAFLLITLVVVLGALFIFVLPRFAAIYADFNAELPLATRVLIGAIDYLPLIAPAIIGAVMAAWFGYRRLAASTAGRLRLHRLRARLPALGNVVAMLNVAQLARSLSALLAAGTPLVEAMRTAEQSLSDRAYAESVTRTTDLVMEGSSLADAMDATRLMPATAVKMVKVGEASGRLDTMLAEIAGFFEERLDNRLTRLMTLIEPALMLLIGVFIGGIIVTMYLPIFSLADVIR